MPLFYNQTSARQVREAGSIAAAVTFATRTVTVFAALTKALHTSPISGVPLGVATAWDPTTASLTVIVNEVVDAAGMLGKFKAAEA